MPKLRNTKAAQVGQYPAMPACATSSFSAFKHDEVGRLRALARADIVDSVPEQPFESIVELVRQVLNVPICAVSLVDLDRQWFKASRGLGVPQTARDISFCTHAIKGATPFIVADATKDPLFVNNPLVTDGPKIRSYVGIPLTTPEGYNVGTLCAIDTVARIFSEHEIAILTNFARLVVGEIELRQIASTDELTGVMSRRAWIDCAEREVHRARRYGAALSFFILDIDHFKAVNDRFGHAVGDQVIMGGCAKGRGGTARARLVWSVRRGGVRRRAARNLYG
jgi:GAF domain-containing protein